MLSTAVGGDLHNVTFVWELICLAVSQAVDYIMHQPDGMYL